MKKIVITIFILILWNSVVLAKEEIRTIFGFYITIPSNFIAMRNENLGELLNKYKGSDIDKDALNNLMGSSMTNKTNIEYFFFTRDRRSQRSYH